MGLIGCLSQAGYRLSMDIRMEANTRVLFLILDGEGNNSKEIRVPNCEGAGIGEKGTLSYYRPMITRHKSSFFRSYHRKTSSLRKRLRASIRKVRLGSEELFQVILFFTSQVCFAIIFFMPSG